MDTRCAERATLYAMIRTQIHLDPRTYESLCRAAAAQGKARSALARDLLARSLGTSPAVRRRRRYGWTFVGMAHGSASDVAREHDAALAAHKRW